MKRLTRITVIVAIIAIILFAIAVISSVRTIALESFSTCPIGSTTFTDASGTTGCCAGTVQGRLCIGTMLCSYAANPPAGVKKCGDTHAEIRMNAAKQLCPPSIPFLLGQTETPAGCCAVQPDINGLCPALAGTCGIKDAKPATTSTSKIDCKERYILETATCPKNYTLSAPTFDGAINRFTATCVDTHLNTCYPPNVYNYLVQTGGLQDTADNRKKICNMK